MVIKEELLALLQEKAGYQSSQELCQHFGVSRTAIWKAINRLREEGCVIEAVPNKGYRLLEAYDPMTKETVEQCLHTEWIGRNLAFYESLDSTNLKARTLAEGGCADGTLVFTEEQTAGRGRLGRTWKMQRGSAIAMSLILRPSILPGDASMLTLVSALALARALEASAALSVKIKWPNDLVVNGKKLVGILTEMSAEMECVHYVVIGIGINVAIREFPPELRETACSILQETGVRISRSQLIADFLTYFEPLYEQFLKERSLHGIRREYEERLANQNAMVRVLDPAGEWDGRCTGINDRGGLLVRAADGEIREVISGEVSVRGLYGYV